MRPELAGDDLANKRLRDAKCRSDLPRGLVALGIGFSNALHAAFRELSGLARAPKGATSAFLDTIVMILLLCSCPQMPGIATGGIVTGMTHRQARRRQHATAQTPSNTVCIRYRLAPEHIAAAAIARHWHAAITSLPRPAARLTLCTMLALHHTAPKTFNLPHLTSPL